MRAFIERHANNTVLKTSLVKARGLWLLAKIPQFRFGLKNGKDKIDFRAQFQVSYTNR